MRFPVARLQKWAILSMIGQYLEETGWKPETRESERVADGQTINYVCVCLNNAPSDWGQKSIKICKRNLFASLKTFP